MNRTNDRIRKKKKVYTPSKFKRFMTPRRRSKTVLCCCLFLIAAILKLGFTEKTVNLRNKISNIIGESIDYKETFSQIGRAMSEEGDILSVFGEIYVAVFGETESSTAYEVNGKIVLDTFPADALWEVISSGSGYSYPEQLKLLSFAYYFENNNEAEAEEEFTDEPEIPAVNIEYDYPDVEAPEDATKEYVALALECMSSPSESTISSEYGYRMHPVYDELKFHYGIDYAMELNENVYAFSDGIVYAAGEEESLGKYLMIDHGNGIMTLYAHLNEFRITEGSEVAAGDIIAGAGETGLATGVNLHFEIWTDDVAVNPLWYLV